MITGFQVNLFTDDVPTLLRFYRELGFAERFRTPAEGPPDHVEVQAHGLTLGITSLTSAHAIVPALGATSGGPGCDLVLWCDNVAADHARAVNLGATEVVAPVETGGRLRVSWVNDPAGNRIKFVQPLRAD